MGPELLRIAQSSAGPLYILVFSIIGGAILAAIKIRPAVMERYNERSRDKQSVIEAQWVRLQAEIGRLAARVESLEAKCEVLSKKVEDCEDDRDQWRTRAMTAEAAHAKLEAVMAGLGEVDQLAARVVAADRLEQRQIGGKR
jgi:chromosome segregation ATPase